MVQKQIDIANQKKGAGSPKYSKNHQSSFHWVPHDESPKYKAHQLDLSTKILNEDTYMSPLLQSTRNILQTKTMKSNGLEQTYNVIRQNSQDLKTVRSPIISLKKPSPTGVNSPMHAAVQRSGSIEDISSPREQFQTV